MLALELFKSNNMAIVYLGFEIWENIKAFIETYEGFEYAHSTVFSAIEFIRGICRYDCSFSEDENWKEYREFAGSTMQSLLLMEYQKNKKRTIDYFKIIAQQAISNTISIESYIFTIISFLEVFDELKDPNLEFIENGLKLVLSSEIEQPLQESALRFFREGAVHLIKLGKSIPEILSYCMKSMSSKVQRLSAEAFVEILKNIKELIPVEVVSIMITEVIKDAQKIEAENLRIISNGIGIAITKSPSEIPRLSIAYIKNIKTLEESVYLNAVIGLFKGLLNGALPKVIGVPLLSEILNPLPRFQLNTLDLTVEMLCLAFRVPKEVLVFNM